MSEARYGDLIEKYQGEYGKHWVEHEASKAIARVQRAIVEKDFSYLVHLRYGSNGFSREVFTRETGIKLHRIQRESKRLLEEFVGPRIAQAFYQEQERHRAKREAECLKRQVGARQVCMHEYGTLWMDEFIEALVTKGYTSIIEEPRGAARQWLLCNGEGHCYTFRRTVEYRYIKSLLEQRKGPGDPSDGC